MKYLCLPYWKDSPAPADVPGWTTLPMWNLGMGINPGSRPRPEGSPVVIDWEYALPKQRFGSWNNLLRTGSKPGDIVYGFDTGVNSALYDEKVGIIAKKLMPYKVAMSYDIYYHEGERNYDYEARVEYRLSRLQEVQRQTGVQSVALMSPIRQYTPTAPDESPSVLDQSEITNMLWWIKGHGLTPCIYAAATTVNARKVVDEAVAMTARIWAGTAKETM